MHLSGAFEAFAQVAPDTGARQAVGHDKLCLASGAKVLFSRLHRSWAGSYRHRTYVDACIAAFAEIGLTAKRKLNAAVFSTPNKAERFGLPHLSTNTDASAAQHAIIVAKRITHFLDSATHRDVLHCAGVRGLSYEKLSNIATQTYYPLGIRTDYHIFSDLQGTGGGYSCFSTYNIFHDAEPTNADVRKPRVVT